MVDFLKYIFVSNAAKFFTFTKNLSFFLNVYVVLQVLAKINTFVRKISQTRDFVPCKVAFLGFRN